MEKPLWWHVGQAGKIRHPFFHVGRIILKKYDALQASYFFHYIDKLNCMQILVFKTNLTDAKRISDVESSLDIHPEIYQWNVDLNDCDNVLRIVSKNIAAQEVESILLHAGYYCEELQ